MTSSVTKPTRTESFSVNIDSSVSANSSPPPKVDKCKRALDRALFGWGETVNAGCGYLLGTQIPLGPTFNRSASGSAGLLVVNGALFATVMRNMDVKPRWIFVATTVVIVAAGFLTGAFVGL